MMGAATLYIVPTPVGNMADMTPRAVEVLRAASVIYAEDTRTSAPLMRHFDIVTPLRSFHKFNEHETVSQVVRLLEEGSNVALISDAGTPGISDPGFLLSRACRERDIAVVTLPGATAFVPALANSGLPCDRFCFEGFLPVKKGRSTALKQIADEARTTVVYESPVRLARTLAELAAACGGDRPAAVSREISKMHEETRRGTLEELAKHYEQNQPKGEIVIVVGGRGKTGAVPHKNKYKELALDN